MKLGSSTGFFDPQLPTSADQILVKVDWQKTGDFTTYGDNVTSLVRPQQEQVSVSYGRDQLTAISPTVAGRGSFVLDNRDRRFSPRNTASPLYGKLKPARPVRIYRQIGQDVYGMFAGHTDDSPINPDVDSHTVSVSLLDYLADFRLQTLSTPVYRDIHTGEAIGYILDACGWLPSLRDIDRGATIIPWWWEDGTDALDALEKVVRSEGSPAMLTVGGDGEIVFRDRHHRLTRAPSLTSQGTWKATGTANDTVMQKGFTYDEAWSKIINSGSVTVDVRTVGEKQTVWTLESPITLAPGEQRTITASTSDPFINAPYPKAGTDFVVLSGTVACTLTRTSGTSTGIVLTAGVGNSAVIRNLQLRAQPITTAYSVQISASDPASILEYGQRSFPSDLPWCGVGDAEAILDLAVATRGQPLPVVTCRFNVANKEKAPKILARDLSERVTIVEPETGLNSDFFIESIGHDLTGVYDHTVTFGLEAVSVPTVAPVRFDTNGAGFDAGHFATAIDLSANLLRFDTTGQGFNAGALAA